MSNLKSLSPPDGLFTTEDACFFAAGEVEVEHLFLLEGCAIGPAPVFFKVGRFLVGVEQRDLVGRALNYLLGLERECCSWGRLRGHLIRDLRKQKNERE